MARATREALPQERQQWILDQLHQHGRVLATELAERFGVSEDSIRRDLRDMAAAGLCRRVYGGALRPTPDFPPLQARIETQDACRAALASHAASLVNAGDVVVLDAGATNVLLARALASMAVTVVTNAPAVAHAMAGGHASVAIIGGRVDPRSGGAIGVQALQQLQQWQANVCFPGTCAVDPDTGAWCMDSEEAAFKRAMVAASDATVIVATDEKIGARGSARIVGFDRIDHLVLGERLPPSLSGRLAVHPTRLHRVRAG